MAFRIPEHMIITLDRVFEDSVSAHALPIAISVHQAEQIALLMSWSI